MKRLLFGASLLAATLAVASPAQAKQWQVKMVTRGPAMVFEPAFVAIKPGDTVKFIATTKGHNAESLPGMLPAGGNLFKGKINEEIEVKFTTPGLYGYKCLPHLGMGMVGLVQVGSAGNKADIAAKATKLPGLSKKVMAGLVAQAR